MYIVKQILHGLELALLPHVFELPLVLSEALPEIQQLCAAVCATALKSLRGQSNIPNRNINIDMSCRGRSHGWVSV